MFSRGKKKTARQVKKEESRAISPKRMDATYSVSVYSAKPQTEYTYTLLPNKERSKQRKIDKAKIVPLEKEEAHKVEMNNLFDFYQMNLVEAFEPEYILEYKISDQQMKKLEKDLLEAFCSFLKYWQDDIGFDKLRTMRGWTDDNFVKFCEEILNLFDEFFLLPEKYKLFVRELAKAIYEKEKKLNDERCNFNNMFVCLVDILLYFATQSEYGNDREISEFGYDFSKKELKAILNNINIPNDKKEIEVRLERLANSAFDKNSDSNKESFAERMERIMEKFSSLRPADIESKNKSLWERIKERLIANDFLNICDVHINCNLIPKKYVDTVLKFFQIEPQSINISFLKKFNYTRMLGNSKMNISFLKRNYMRMPSNSKIRRDLFVVMALFVYFNNGSQNNSTILSDFFRCLTQEERFEIVHSDVQWRGQSLPLLLVFLLQDKLRDATIDLIRDFLPEIFDIRFRVDEKKKTHNIMGLLKEIKDFCNKKFGERYTTEKENLFYDLLKDYNVEHIMSRLKEIKKQRALESKPKPEQKLKPEIERTPSTELEMVSRRKYEISDCCLVNLFRCVVAKFR